MANTKSFYATYIPNQSLNITVVKTSDNTILDPATGMFEEYPSSNYIPMYASSNISGLYYQNESRNVWLDGSYMVLVYNSSYTEILGSSIINITSDVITNPVVINASTNFLTTGTNLLQIQLIDTSSNPVIGVLIEVLDPTNSMILTNGVSNSSGIYSFSLDSGNYILNFSKVMYSFGTNIPITLSGDTSLTYVGVPLYANIPLVPEMQTIFGTVLKADGTPDVGQVVSIVIKSPQVLPDYILSKSILSSQTDINGNFSVVVVQGATIQFSITNWYTYTFTVTSANSASILSYIPS
jgi:hypothetical protein